ncbi:uncharacterized protein LOC131635951 [Vicia villosa]|uniref:uncharacterized protein LOC131635951 n=1 Tax=Vicia villosa TaxID=3911 RepID=UPI00273ACA5C|nr:uncharacterized protein LOC131635951 [Vicia villosa]
MVINCKTLYNCIIERPTLAELAVVPSTVHLKMKFYTKKGRVATIKANIEAARRIFDASMKGLQLITPPSIANKKPRAEDKLAREDLQQPTNVSSVNLDARFTKEELKNGEEPQPRTAHPVRPIPNGDFELVPLGNPDMAVKIGKDIPDLPRTQLVACLRANADLFAWSVAKMPGLNAEVACHHLSINPAAKAVVQRYNQIPMERCDKQCTTFMTESDNYYYNVMPFRLKNAGATYQRMMNKVFRGEIGDTLEVYMDDKIVKSREETDHTTHLERVFEQARSYKMRFNLEKCTFGVRAEINPSLKWDAHGAVSIRREIRPTRSPFFKLLRKETTFEWCEECEQALSHLKQVLLETPVLSRPGNDDLYLAVSNEAVSAALIREADDGKKPIYFTSKALQGPDVRYQQIEKVALALIIAARRLRYYFLAHTVVVRTDQPIKQLLGRPDMARRMLKWSLELSEFDIQYESRKALKAQALADFVAEMTSITSSPPSAENKWSLYGDGASSSSGCRAGVILENDEGLVIEVSLVLSFTTSNNQAEYEAFLPGLQLAENVGAQEVKIYTDFQLVASQVNGEYLALVKERMKNFARAEVEHIPREHNSRAGVLSKLASTRKKGGNKSVIQEILSKPSVDKNAPLTQVLAIGDDHCWMTPVYNFLTKDELPTDAKEASTIKRRACSYVIVEDKLYRRGFSTPLLKCVDASQALEILQELHEGINGQHLGGRSLARKALRARYYWSTMQQDAKEHIQKCDKCQRHANMHLAPPHELKSISSPWPFSTWGMDLLGPFPIGSYQNKYLVVAIDYFTKWIKAEALAKITAQNMLRFYKRNVLARFGVPQAIITDNGTQFTDRKFQEFVSKLGTKKHFTSVEHPQTNGQAEAANRVILRGLKRRLDEAKRAWVEELHSSPLEEELSDEAMREELDMVEEIRTGSSLREAKLKQQIALRHNTKVI